MENRYLPSFRIWLFDHFWLMMITDDRTSVQLNSELPPWCRCFNHFPDQTWLKPSLCQIWAPNTRWEGFNLSIFNFYDLYLKNSQSFTQTTALLKPLRSEEWIPQSFTASLNLPPLLPRQRFVFIFCSLLHSLQQLYRQTSSFYWHCRL